VLSRRRGCLQSQRLRQKSPSLQQWQQWQQCNPHARVLRMVRLQAAVGAAQTLQSYSLSWESQSSPQTRCSHQLEHTPCTCRHTCSVFLSHAMAAELLALLPVGCRCTARGELRGNSLQASGAIILLMPGCSLPAWHGMASHVDYAETLFELTVKSHQDATLLLACLLPATAVTTATASQAPESHIRQVGVLMLQRRCMFRCMSTVFSRQLCRAVVHKASMR
jgi:hypothetical protein